MSESSWPVKGQEVIPQFVSWLRLVAGAERCFHLSPNRTRILVVSPRAASGSAPVHWLLINCRCRVSARGDKKSSNAPLLFPHILKESAFFFVSFPQTHFRALRHFLRERKAQSVVLFLNNNNKKKYRSFSRKENRKKVSLRIFCPKACWGRQASVKVGDSNAP